MTRGWPVLLGTSEGVHCYLCCRTTVPLRLMTLGQALGSNGHLGKLDDLHSANLLQDFRQASYISLSLCWLIFLLQELQVPVACLCCDNGAVLLVCLKQNQADLQHLIQVACHALQPSS